MPPSPSTPAVLTERRRSTALWLLTASLLVLAVTTVWTTTRVCAVSSFASKQFESLRDLLELYAQIDITAEPYLASDPMTSVRDPSPVLLTGTLILATLNITTMLCLLKWRARR